MTEYGWPVKDATSRMYEALQPMAVEDAKWGWPLLAYLDAIGRMFQDGADLVQDGPNGEPGWSIVLDIDRIPDAGLDWLGQFIGQRFPVGMDAATKRQQIRNHFSWARGTPANIIDAVRLYLTGTKTADIAERTGSAYHFTVTIWAAEAPASTADLIAYVNTYAKPAGLWWTLTVNPGTPPALLYSQIYNRGDTYLYLYNTFQTINDIH